MSAPRENGILENVGADGGLQSNITHGLADTAQRLEEKAQLLVTSNDSEIIRQTLRLYGSMYIAIFLVFCYVRRKFPKLYNVRSWVPELKCELAQQTSFGFFNWAWRVFQVTDEQLLTNCGMDAMCFLRCLRLGTKLSLIGCFNAIWLIPIYYTAGGITKIEEEDTFVLMSVANLGPESPRFAAVVAAAYIMVIASLYLLSKEYNWYIQYRHKFLSLRTPRNFAVYVSGIPEVLQSDHALTDFFQRSRWTSTVLEANVAMNIPKLEAKVAKREIVLQKLEHAMAMEKLKGKVTTHRTFKIQNATHDIKNVSQLVDSVQTYRELLDDLNKQISLEIGKVKNSNHRLRRHLTKQQCDSNILRGRTLTPCYDELRSELDLESGNQSFNQDVSMPSVESEEGDGSLYWRESAMLDSSKSVLQQQLMLSEEIPEEGTHVPDVDFQILPVINSGDSEDESSAEEIEEGVKILNEDAMALVVAEDKSMPYFDGVSKEIPGQIVDDTVSADVENHPFLQLVGMADFQDIAGSTGESSATSAFADPQGNESVPSNEKPPSHGDDHENAINAQILHHEEESGYPTETDAQIDAVESETPKERNLADIVPSSDRRNLTGYGSTESMKTGSSNSILSTGSNIKKRASSSVRHIHSNIRSTVRVETVTGGVKKARDLSLNGTKKVRDLGVKGSKTVRESTLKATKLSKKAAEYGLKQAHHQLTENAAALAPMLRFGGEGAPRTAGFVTFKDHYTAQAALQMLQHPSSKSMLVEEAPSPSEVYWRNVGLPDKARRTGTLLSLSATVALCLFWSFPVAFISSLTEVNSLKESLPRLGDVIENSPALEMFLALLAPLILLLLNEAVLPVILKWFSLWEGAISSPRLEASLFRKLSAFQIIQTFFISTISGSLTSELTNMIDNPESIVEFLANSLPTQSSYFIQLVLVFTFLIHGLELLRVTPLGYALVRTFVGPNLTAKERRKKWKFLYSLEDPPEFWHAETFSQIVLFYVVFFVYAPISPITSVFLLGCFLILESGYRYLFIHDYSTSPDSGGRIWAGFVVLMFAGIFIGQLTLIGLLILNSAFYAVPALVPLVIITILFIIYVHPVKMHVAKNLPAIMCLDVDRADPEADNDPSNYDFLRGKFLQPALTEPFVFPDESSFTSRSSRG
jgi:hypothetical protein